ncbi:MAG: hypothetical protein ACLPV8_24500 [Steroidobacteraceae bacterium]
MKIEEMFMNRIAAIATSGAFAARVDAAVRVRTAATSQALEP